MTEPNFDCPEFPETLTYREAIMQQEGVDGWAAEAMFNLYVRDEMIEREAHALITTTETQGDTLRRWGQTIINALRPVVRAMNEMVTSFRGLIAALRAVAARARWKIESSTARFMARHPDVAALDRHLDRWYTDPLLA